PFVRDPHAKIDGSSLAEAFARLAGSGIQSKEARVQGDVEEPLVELVFPPSAGNRRVPLPVGHTAIGHGATRAALAGKRIEHPELFSRFCIYRNSAAGLGREVQHAFHHQRSALKSLNSTIGSWCDLISPGPLELLNVRVVDLRQGREARSPGIVAIVPPLGID